MNLLSSHDRQQQILRPLTNVKLCQSPSNVPSLTLAIAPCHLFVCIFCFFFWLSLSLSMPSSTLATFWLSLPMPSSTLASTSIEVGPSSSIAWRSWPLIIASVTSWCRWAGVSCWRRLTSSFNSLKLLAHRICSQHGP